METDLESAQIYADIKLRKETPRHSADKGKQQETTSDYMSFCLSYDIPSTPLALFGISLLQCAAQKILIDFVRFRR